MKKFNKNSLLFVFAIVFIVFGIWGNCFKQLWLCTMELLVGVKNGDPGSVSAFTASVNKVSSERLSYHDFLMDVNSVKENISGTRIIIKEDQTIVKSDSGSLIEPVGKLDKTEIRKAVELIDNLKTVSEDNGADFLYCAAPKNEYYQETPKNVENCFKENYDNFLCELADSDIPYIDFAQTINGASGYKTFFDTDHHWTVRSGFEANRALVEELNARYGFEYEKERIDISSYNIEEYRDWFLGSRGKKTGTYFTWNGADDFELITPKFKTDLIEEQPFKDQIRTGDFKDTVLFTENMNKDYYNSGTYDTYCGGESRLQIVKNNLEPNGKKVLLIRDSFACVVAPFLALNTSELHICDMRDYKMHVGEKINAEEYIKEIRPDYVIVLYSGISSIGDSNGKFDFF